MSSSQKVAIVTGASQGLGAAIVQAYLDKGYRVIATSRSIKPSDNPNVVTVAGDVADRETARRVINEAITKFGRVDTLINNAGIFITKPFTAHSDEDYAAITGTNLTGFFHMTQLAIAEMEKNKSGHVVNITTSLVEHPLESVPSVLASLTKGGIASATKSLAIEYAKRGIRVNAVSPGIIKTPMHTAEKHEYLAKLHPLGQMGEASDIVGAVIYLEFASYVTGEILNVDGGRSAGH
jgi:NAD(P)-dependent dehydrogenase (short-subunit alcohol dehydrogenase family)